MADTASSLPDPTHHDRPSEPANKQDPIMSEDGNHSESDHCRICRGEGTAGDPLFYPCKCNGSIRFVHQGCLMQWLSHSQKKQCELCKTPFRFTKLYDPNMPSVVPWTIFIRQASIHALRFTLKCARWLLVLFVWLGWVPWCIRTVWRGLFWIGDGAWITQQQLDRHSRGINSTMASMGNQAVFSVRASMLPNSGSTVLGNNSQVTNPSWQEPMLVSIGRWILNTIILPYSVLANTTVEIKWIEGPTRRPSLLSDVGMLKAPTRWRFVNDTLIDILEGQLVTIVILVTFILMFLIREWVVQQQPMINLGVALDNEAANQQAQAAVPVPLPPALAPTEVALVEEDESLFVAPPTPEPEDNDYISIDFTQTQSFDEISNQNRSSEAEALLTPPASVAEAQENRGLLDEEQTLYKSDRASPFSVSPTRPSMPSKEVASQAPNIARILEEQSQTPDEIEQVTHSDERQSTRDFLQDIPTLPEEISGNSVTPEDSRDNLIPMENNLDIPIILEASRDTETRTMSSAHQPQIETVEQPIPFNQAETVGEKRITNNVAEWMWGDIPEGSDRSGLVPDEWQTEVESDDNVDEQNREERDEVENNNTTNAQPQEPAVAEPDPVNPNQDAEPIQAAVAAAGIEANDIEQLEDGEDMDDMLELIGMQGPLAGLLQNGMFSTVIISMTVLWGIWLPYLMGKLVLIVLANPLSLLVKLPLRWTSMFADLLVDSFIFASGFAYYWLDRFIRLTASPLSWILPVVKKAGLDDKIPATAYRFTWSAADRLAKNMALSGGYFSNSDIPVFSILAHESLERVKHTIYSTSTWIFRGFKDLVEHASQQAYLVSRVLGLGRAAINTAVGSLAYAVGAITTGLKSFRPSFDMFRISLDIPTRTTPLQLAPWTAGDRTVAVILGYLFFASLGFLYLKIRRLFRNVQGTDKPADGMLVDILTQAGGVLKVVLIITIEMLLFPLYCGFLLDAALLPLFGNATPSSRIAFLNDSPWTSMFIHWFTGTCYMFHFALFVAMCRKILRPGVLYFIRDPDDPTFHPVRDVLERNVATQLRKILFSALVYGALVIICLGAVVWGIPAVIKGVFPIHWSSNEPVLEFPADLLVYNFLIPLAVRVLKPSLVLQDMYNWWFRKCARFLRMSHFLFGERNEDEEGYVVWQKGETDGKSDDSDTRDTRVWPIIRHGRLSWQTNPTKLLSKSYKASLSSSTLTESDSPSAGYTKTFVRNGRLVRAPASDQVRISKGNKTFVDIDPETGNRKDGLPETPNGLHGKENKMFSDIYVPPYFRVRIAGFIVLIWAFAAATGVSLTVVPLLLGRFVFARLIQSHPRMNDVYAFAIGFYLLAGPIWLVMNYRPQITRAMHHLESSFAFSTESIKLYAWKGANFFLQLLRIFYFYGAMMVLLPSLLGLTWEAYILIPLHTYFQRDNLIVPQHTVHFVSDWTLGVLFVRVAVHVMLKYPQSRPTKALLALVSAENQGSSWFNPDIKLATRAFVVPLTASLLLALILPLQIGKLLISHAFVGINQDSQTIIYRYSYPFTMALALSYLFLRVLQQSINKWRIRVRDEVYLVKERLHNFDDKRTRTTR